MIIILDLVELPIIMFEQASLAVGAEQSVIESCTYLGLVFGVINWRGLANQFMVSMCKLALGPIAAQADFYPVLAHFRLVLRLVDLKDLLLLRKRLEDTKLLQLIVRLQV